MLKLLVSQSCAESLEIDSQDVPPEDILKASYAYGSSPLTTAGLKEPHEMFLFGYPIAHSMAPQLHTTLFNGLNIPWSYKLLETKDPSLFLPAPKAPSSKL